VRVLFTSLSGLGHVHPMLPLALALQVRGHEVRWAVAAQTCSRVEQAGIKAIAAGLDFSPGVEEYRRRYPEAAALPREERRAHAFLKLFGEINAPPMVADLLRILQEWMPDLVVHDAAELAAPIAASSAGVPHVTHAYGAVIPPQMLAAVGEEVAQLWRSAGLAPRPFGGSYDHLYLDVYPASMQSADMTHIPWRQPLRPVAFDALGDEGLLSELVQESDRPLVYLTFGTRFNDNPTFHAAVEAIREFDVQLLVTVGPSGDPTAFGPQPVHVRVERYVPQTLVLDRCDVVASHAGSGTLLAALARGIPQLCLPQGGDQFGNAASCARVGAGLALRPEEADRNAISNALKRLLADPSFRDSAATVATEIEGMPSPEQVAGVVEALA
jgi:UDP:flavonoid glycosyltransferase YjiC (YdhE family)